MRPILCFFTTLSLAAADPLPREIEPQPAVLEAQPDEDGRKVWHTKFFRLDSDMPLRPAELARLSQVADTTALVLKDYPLPLFAPPQGQRCRLSIYADAKDYVSAGGGHGTAGFYVARRGYVVLDGEYFVDGPDRKLYPPNYHEDIMVHELIHLGMHRVNPKLPHWMLEGLAEYFACAHKAGGKFSFAEIDKAVRDHLRSRLSPEDPGLPLVPVADLVGLGGHGWLDYVNALPEAERYQAYATALLIAHYHLHGGAQRLATLKTALEGEKESALITKEEAPAIQAALTRYWKPKGLTLEFAVKK